MFISNIFLILPNERYILFMEVSMSDLLNRASELLFKDANVLIQFRDWFFSQAGNILLALIIFWVGRYAIKWVKTFAVRIMTKASYDSAAMSFITQIINYALLVGLILICLNQIGVPTTSFVAAFGAFGLGIGLALQNNLSNLASGLLILIFKPFRAGHVIQVGDTVGSVKSIQFMYTIITTKDQKNVYIPNSILTSQAITNIAYTHERVIPFVFDIGYNNNHHEAIKILKNIFRELSFVYMGAVIGGIIIAVIYHFFYRYTYMVTEKWIEIIVVEIGCVYILFLFYVTHRAKKLVDG